jgi:hypothetical protein
VRRAAVLRLRGRFSGARWERSRPLLGVRPMRTALRTAHTIAFAALYGGHVYDVSAVSLHPALAATVATGAAFMALEMYRTPLWPVQVRGVAAFVKLALVAAVGVWWDWRLLLLTLALVIGGVVSHMPGRYRYYSLLHGRVVGQQEAG